MSAPTRELPRMLAYYRETIAPTLQSEFNYDNVMQIPRLTKIVVNMGVGEATRDAKLMDGAVRHPKADGRPRPRPHRDHRPEAGRGPGPQVHRAVQAARGHADRREGHPPQRPDVGVPGPAAVAGPAPHP